MTEYRSFKFLLTSQYSLLRCRLCVQPGRVPLALITVPLLVGWPAKLYL